MATIQNIRQRAQQLAEKWQKLSISPEEVGLLIDDLAALVNDAVINGSSLGIRRTYDSLSAMNSDGTVPNDQWGEPLKRGQLVAIASSDADAGKIYMFTDPNWAYVTTVDARYVTTDALAEEITKIEERCDKIEDTMTDLNDTVVRNKEEADAKLTELEGKISESAKSTNTIHAITVKTGSVYDFYFPQVSGTEILYSVDSKDGINTTSCELRGDSGGALGYGKQLNTTENSVIVTQEHIKNGVRYFRIYFADVTGTVEVNLSIRYVQGDIASKIAENSERIDNVPTDISLMPLQNFSFADVVLSDNLFNKNDKDVLIGKYLSDDNRVIDGASYSTSGFIEVEEDREYKKANVGDKYLRWYFFDSEKNPVIVSNGKFYVSPGEKYTIPSSLGIKFCRFMFSNSESTPIDQVMFGVSSADFSQYIPYEETATIKPEYIPKDETPIVAESDYNMFGVSSVGPICYENVGNATYSQIILYGQSLSMGWEAPEVITTTAVDGNYMVGVENNIFGTNRDPKELNPLVAVKWTSGGECPIVACTNAFSQLYRRFVDKNQKFIGSNVGQGGMSIERLSKESTNGENFYTTRFLKLLDATKNIVEGKGETVSCSAILYMQGEMNYQDLTGHGLTPEEDATNNKDEYKALLLTLKNNMQSDIMAKYGQKNKPLFFIYQTGGTYINNEDMSITMAQIEFVLENDDVFFLPPTYPYPDYGGGHLSTNGYRWYGEAMAKTLYDVMIKGGCWKPIFPMEISKKTNNIINIDFYVPVLPLVFDTNTKEEVKNYGFKVINDGEEVAISAIEVNLNRVIITCSEELTGTVYVSYAGMGRNGSGNLRDSDEYMSMYTYYDDRETSPDKRENFTPKDAMGEFIYNKRYPMYNWCSNFYLVVE